ncbi:MAG: TetR family transcriptional regulator [Kiloniellaceae bacterium]
MNDSVLTSEQIRDAAEQGRRRYGPAKTTVVDVARALDVSHGSIYRHFPSKAALRDAVAARWLHRVSQPLRAIVEEDGPAPQRLRRWYDILIATKRAKILDDPELFATYHGMIMDSREVVEAHVEELVAQIARIIASGVKRGEFAIDNPRRAAEALFHATTRYHNPLHKAEWRDPNIGRDFDALWSLLMAGLGAKAAQKP